MTDKREDFSTAPSAARCAACEFKGSFNVFAREPRELAHRSGYRFDVGRCPKCDRYEFVRVWHFSFFTDFKAANPLQPVK